MPITGLEIPIISLSIDGIMLIAKKFSVKTTYNRSSHLQQAAVSLVMEVNTLLDRKVVDDFEQRANSLRDVLDEVYAQIRKGYLIPSKELRAKSQECLESARVLEAEAITLSARAKGLNLHGHEPPSGNVVNIGSQDNVVNNVTGNISNHIDGNVVHNHVHNHYHIHQHVHVIRGVTAPSLPDAAMVEETVSNALSTELSHFPDVQETDATPPPVDPIATTSIITELVPPPSPEEDTRTDTPTTIEVCMELWNSDS